MVGKVDGAVIVVSSHVLRGAVGNRAVVFTLERLGFTVWAVPTIVLPFHLGHGPSDKSVPDGQLFARQLEFLLRDNRGAGVAAVISGFLASPEQADAVAALVRTVKAARPDALYLCDPVIGDAGRLYVPEPVAAAVRDRLLPLADIATPNAFECAWLAGAEGAAEPDLAALARGLPPPVVIATSAPGLMRGHIGNLLTEPGGEWLLEHPALPNRAHGTGDVLSALLLARRLEGHDWPKAAEMAVSSVFEIVAGTSKAGADELLIPEFQHAIVQPRAPVSIRRIGRR
ncbi:MAG: bifunctional hydroxymethylpyrimidine kinase/phosphomethylpyrimidine kinase [Rhizobiales bacterium]|jgi:pyridoxine kinase|nr:bifunctional hydroxymethylpyrimidine kinase/phosphomethylpyrimidine kinase [Hyphomicrobiales bacterium]